MKKLYYPSWALTLFQIILFQSSSLFALIPPTLNIPRTPTKHFISEGLFQGGKPIKAKIVGLRFSSHAKNVPSQSYERWVLDFEDIVSGKVGITAPLFQVRYEKSETQSDEHGISHITTQPRFVFSFKSIHKNLLNRDKLKKLASRSTLVQDVVVYPMIEDGDLSMEFILKKDVLFEAHQPLQNEGRLVLDLKAP
jgi:hypothetical protein